MRKVKIARTYSMIQRIETKLSKNHPQRELLTAKKTKAEGVLSFLQSKLKPHGH